MTMRNEYKKGFTLVELLVVVAIILILAGLMFTVFRVVRIGSYKTKARETVSQISTAWTAYNLENRNFPDVDITEMDRIGCAYVNTNLTENVSVMNLDLTRKETQEGMKDSWGGIFQVILDNGRGRDSKGYDGQITVPDGTTIQRSVAVWSKGPDGVDGTADDIRNWQ